ncbi:MAG: SDR family NAD(P)-dependent oxidoreductase [Candidatus Rokubacteria bacterium]|nr:SDR family NAD(P)-dependent oxidoreductase [Candidatus Rokubacteria bacterium]
MANGGRLNERVAIVTAAAGAGMGRAIAERFATEGARVVLTDAHQKRVSEEAARFTEKFGYPALGMAVDVRSQEQVDACVRKTLEAYGRIDILYNNAGINKLQNVWELSDETWDLVIGVCLTGTFRFARAVLPSMIDRKTGVVINVSSIAGWHSDTGGGGGQSAYAAAKSGIMGFTRAVAAEVGRYGIRVNAIAPGLIYNPFLERIYPKEWFAQKAQETVLGRMGNPDDVASLAVYLASDEAAFITGEVLCVSGGRYMHA